MSQSPPAPLLRLREADVVRLCGLEAAASGLELSSHQAVTHTQREGARLEGRVSSAGETYAVWIELQGEPGSGNIRWGCARHALEGAHAGRHGCEDVAGILTTWIRHPEDFLILPGAEVEAPQDVRAVAAPQRPPVETALPRGASKRMSASLADELRRMPADDLVATARRVVGSDLAGDDISMEGAYTLLHATLTDPVLLHALVARLDPGAGELLTTIMLLGGVMTAADLEALARRSGRPLSALRGELAVLERHGLLFRATPRASTTRGWDQLAGWRIAPEVRARLAPTLPIEQLRSVRGGLPQLASPFISREAESGPMRAEPRIVRADIWKLAQALALLARAPAPLGPLAPAPGNLRFYSASSMASNTLTQAPGDLPSARLADLARGTGIPIGMARIARRVLFWARERDPHHPLTDLATVPTDRRMAALRAGFRLWLEAESPAELADLDLVPGGSSGVRARYDPTHPSFRLATLAGEVAEARAFVASLVALARPGEWYVLGDLCELVWRIQPYFLRGRQRSYSTPAWWLESAAGRVLRPTLHDEWLAGEGAYLGLLLGGPLHWWGVVDLAVDASRRPLAFRLTPLGASLLGGAVTNHDELPVRGGSPGPVVLPMRAGALAVDPLDAGAALLEVLERWMRPVAVRGGRLIYEPAPELAAAAFDRGERPDALLAQLRAVGDSGGARGADALSARLEAWHARYGRAEIIAGMTLLEAADEASLVETLAALPDVAPRIHQLSAAHALLTPEDAARLRVVLARRGYAL
jgi:hypothetical protein